MSAGINQSHKPVAPCRDHTYTPASILDPSSHQNTQYLTEEANWTQSTSFETSENSKSVVSSGWWIAFVLVKVFKMSNTSEHTAGADNAFVLVFDYIQTYQNLTFHAHLYTHCLYNGPTTGSQHSNPCSRFHFSHHNTESSTPCLSSNDDLGVRPECPHIMKVLFGELLDCDRERASIRNAPWVFVWVLMVLTSADRC